MKIIPETAKHTPTLAVYENRHGGFDLKDADSTLVMPLASARTKELADTIVLCVNSHDALVAALARMVAAREKTVADRETISDPYGTTYTATQTSGMWAVAMLAARDALTAAQPKP